MEPVSPNGLPTTNASSPTRSAPGLPNVAGAKVSGKVSGSAQTDALIHVADIFPTVADLAGVPLGGPEGEWLDEAHTHALDGRSLLGGEVGRHLHVDGDDQVAGVLRGDDPLAAHPVP